MDKHNDLNTPILVWRNSSKETCQIAVEDRVFIGRTCQGVAKDKRVIVNEPNVSRDHAVLSWSNGKLKIKDTSRNGTYVNGVRITAGSELVLKAGDNIEIGRLSFEVILKNSEEFVGETIASDATCVMSVTKTVTHLVADVRGFTGITQRMASNAVLDLLSDVFRMLTEVVHRYQGTVKDFAGDAIYAFWEHGEYPSAQKIINACAAAKEQSTAINSYLQALADEDPLRHLTLGWGISTGEATLSHYGIRQDNLALVGDSTNLAFRLAALANNTLPQPIVVCSKSAKLAGSALVLNEVGMVKTKGRKGSERVYSFIEMP